ncbi:cathepsin l1-like [Lynx pardinus]|uniref:Cathepsin l1-like n=1 Tax=Lynx pardinus TaxID=191816 RepID=A0A485MZP8_LYNPA|nr:cathepsin l1-like [Lynx pardinus]
MQMTEQHNREHSQGKHNFMMAMNVLATCEEFKQVLNDLKIQKHKKGKRSKHLSLLRSLHL